MVRPTCSATNPSIPEIRMEPHFFRTSVLERLRLPLRVAKTSCDCGAHRDSLGRHGVACPCSGRLRTRVLVPERTISRVRREAGATVSCNAKIREINVSVVASVERAVDVLASGLPLFHGASWQQTLHSAARCQRTVCAVPTFAVEDGVWKSSQRQRTEVRRTSAQ